MSGKKSGGSSASAEGGGTKLFEQQNKAVAATDTAAKLDSSTIDPWSAVGGASDQIRMNQQLLAASDPAQYGINRDAALERVKNTVNEYYRLSLSSFLEAGEDLRGAENKALAATAKIKQIEMDQFHPKYPEADLGKYIGATAHKSNKYFSAGAVSGKKRATRKKK
jgi:negative regulator of replication initiation